MKIGYVVPEFPSQTHIFFWREIQALRSLGSEVNIISTRRADLSAVEHDFAKPASYETYYLHPPKFSYLVYAFLNIVWFFSAFKYAITMPGFKNKLLNMYFILLAAGLRLYAKRNELAHIHGHSCAHVAHILAMASLKGGPSYSLTLHGGLSTYGDNHWQKFVNAKFVSTVTKPLQADVMALMSWDDFRIPVISMGVNINRFKGIPRIIDESQPLRLISVARLALGKGHKYTLQALAKLKNKQGLSWRYCIVGNGPDESEIKKMAVDLGISNWVDFKGSLGESAVIDQLEQSDILMLTSVGTFEAAPVCVMEAMASGIPTITSIIGGTKDMITHGVDGFLVQQESVNEIYDALLQVFNQRDLVNTMGANARKSALEQFDYNVLAQRLLNHCLK